MGTTYHGDVEDLEHLRLDGAEQAVEEDGVEKSTEDLAGVLAVEYLVLSAISVRAEMGIFPPVQKTHNVYRYCRVRVHGVSFAVSLAVSVDACASANASTAQPGRCRCRSSVENRVGLKSTGEHTKTKKFAV